MDYVTFWHRGGAGQSLNGKCEADDMLHRFVQNGYGVVWSAKGHPGCRNGHRLWLGYRKGGEFLLSVCFCGQVHYREDALED